MSNYFYFQHSHLPFQQRFDETEHFHAGYTVHGLDDWQALTGMLTRFLPHGDGEPFHENESVRIKIIHDLCELAGLHQLTAYEQETLVGAGRSTAALILTLLLARLRKFYQPMPDNHCPRLFISHRRADEQYALRMAEIANQYGFAFWVDVLDPDLKNLAQSSIPPPIESLLTACIIEMALINCTHVIACMTTETRGSLWLPYEYGRITELPGASRKAAAWIHPNVQPQDVPEYMLLGISARTEKDITGWLNTERNFCTRKFCTPVKEELFALKKTGHLPEESDEEVAKKKKEFDNWLKQGLPTLKDFTVGKSLLRKIRKE